jgi:hypothetical protein
MYTEPAQSSIAETFAALQARVLAAGESSGAMNTPGTIPTSEPDFSSTAAALTI